jgi:hypothetical protein
MLSLTPAQLEAAYELLRTTPPFRGWKLPHADDVAFSVIRAKDRFADYEYLDGTHHIRVSQAKQRQLGTLLATMAHEMCHLRMEMTVPKNSAEHGAAFHRLADQVCRWHGWDRGAF